MAALFPLPQAERIPRHTIMHAPGDTDVTDYAEDRGFRSTRSLDPQWTVLGPITDVAREDDQWQ